MMTKVNRNIQEDQFTINKIIITIQKISNLLKIKINELF